MKALTGLSGLSGMAKTTKKWLVSVSDSMTLADTPSVSTIVTKILDNFTDADSTALGAHTISPTNTPATIWTVISGTWVVLTNTAQQTDGSVNVWVFPVCDSGVSDCTVSNDITWTDTNPGTVDNSAGVVVRATDLTNFWYSRIETSNSTIVLRDMQAGTTTTRASAAYTPPTSGTTDNFAIVCNGATLTVNVNGVQKLTYASATFNQTVTKHGPGGYRDVTHPSAKFDNFKVTVP